MRLKLPFVAIEFRTIHLFLPFGTTTTLTLTIIPTLTHYYLRKVVIYIVFSIFFTSNCECLSSEIRSEWMQFMDHPQFTKTSMVLMYFALNYCNESAEFCEDKKAFVNCILKMKHFFPFLKRINAKEKDHLFSLLLSHYVSEPTWFFEDGNKEAKRLFYLI